MFKAYKKYWMGYVDFTGRSTRSDYWLAVLANTIVGIILFSIVIVVTVLIVRIVIIMLFSAYCMGLQCYIVLLTIFHLLPFRCVAYVMPVFTGH